MRPRFTLKSADLAPMPFCIRREGHLWDVVWVVPVLTKRKVGVLSSPQSVN